MSRSEIEQQLRYSTRCRQCETAKAECDVAGNLFCGFCAADAMEMGVVSEEEVHDITHIEVPPPRRRTTDTRAVERFSPMDPYNWQ